MKSQKTECQLQTRCRKRKPENELPYAVAADSFTGLVRFRNEDSFLYAWDSGRTHLLAAVADGIGSTRNGDIAGNYSLQMLAKAWRDFTFPDVEPREAVKQFLCSAICDINRRLYEVNAVTASDYEQDSLGTSLIVAVFLEDAVIAANAGDSPLFRIRDGKIRQLTFDHNLANELVRMGQVAPEDAASIQGARMLTRFIGPKDEVVPECYISNVKKNDFFLLCSDGLTLHVPPAEIARTVSPKEDLSDLLKSLFRKTLHRGAADNATAILVKAL